MIKKITLFGSYARGDAKEISDVDLIIDTNRQLWGLKFFGLVYDIEQLLPKRVDIYETSEINIPSDFYNKIINEGVVIYGE
jgi:predicted nucleotidyltransferase